MLRKLGRLETQTKREVDVSGLLGTGEVMLGVVLVDHHHRPPEVLDGLEPVKGVNDGHGQDEAVAVKAADALQVQPVADLRGQERGEQRVGLSLHSRSSMTFCCAGVLSPSGGARRTSALTTLTRTQKAKVERMR